MCAQWKHQTSISQCRVGVWCLCTCVSVLRSWSSCIFYWFCNSWTTIQSNGDHMHVSIRYAFFMIKKRQTKQIKWWITFYCNTFPVLSYISSCIHAKCVVLLLLSLLRCSLSLFIVEIVQVVLFDSFQTSPSDRYIPYVFNIVNKIILSIMARITIVSLVDRRSWVCACIKRFWQIRFQPKAHIRWHYSAPCVCVCMWETIMSEADTHTLLLLLEIWFDYIIFLCDSLGKWDQQRQCKFQRKRNATKRKQNEEKQSINWSKWRNQMLCG